MFISTIPSISVQVKFNARPVMEHHPDERSETVCRTQHGLVYQLSPYYKSQFPGFSRITEINSTAFTKDSIITWQLVKWTVLRLKISGELSVRNVTIKVWEYGSMGVWEYDMSNVNFGFSN